MRRVVTLSIAAAVLLLALAIGLAEGKVRSTPPTQPLPPYVPPDSTSDPALAHAPSAASQNASVHVASDAASLTSLGVGGVGLLMLSLLVARRARGPRTVRPPKRSFEAGRTLGRSTRVGSEADALARLRAPDVGQVTALGANPGRVRVQIARRRGEPCELVSGYLTGLFEEAWASDVALRHDSCSGRKRATPCEYDIIRVSVPTLHERRG